MGEPYLVKFSPGNSSANRVDNSSPVNGDVVLEAVDTPSGTLFYAVPRDRVVHDSNDGSPVSKGVPLQSHGRSKDLPETSIEVLQKRNVELEKEVALLRVKDELLTSQNEQLMNRLMDYADMAMERLRGEEEDARESKSRASSSKSSRTRRRAREDEGPETKS